MKTLLQKAGAVFIVVMLAALSVAAQQPVQTAELLDPGSVHGPDDQDEIRALGAREAFVNASSIRSDFH